MATTELLAGGLVGNVARHPTGPVRLRLRRSSDLVCEVSDGSLTMPRIRHASETDEGGGGRSSSPRSPMGGHPPYRGRQAHLDRTANVWL